ncbi:hypothetical protein U5817_15865 [Aromatoleum evansii]|uniref:Uncharacterized protein n=1 Tax=Aromatoleum evansii TaxID=59406 RepID=A0ABZ1AJT9_AROEV|nr:hypothetical protein U5817_15865 [Aromatoleum evansii]
MKIPSSAFFVLLLCSASVLAQTTTAAKPASMRMAPVPFKGTDYSGVYDCRGMDSHEGPYNGVVTLELVPSQSNGEHGAYRFKLEVPGYGEYPGHAAAKGREMGIFFANTDPAPKDYGTGLASFAKGKNGKWTFTKYYYQPEFKGGNFGNETCFQR